MKNLSLTSDRQRNFVAGGIVVAIIGTFFPAIRASFMSASLAQSPYGFGILALLIFAFACIFFQPEIIKIIKNKFDKSIDSDRNRDLCSAFGDDFFARKPVLF